MIEANSEISESHLDMGSRYPLRIMGNKLAAPYELAPYDLVTLSLVRSDIGQVHLIAEETQFPRWLFISESPNRLALTMAGYLGNNNAEVYSWKDRSTRYSWEAGWDEDLEKRKIVRKAQGKLAHFEKPEEALEKHTQRIRHLKTKDLTLETLQNIYEAIVYTVPRY